MLIRTMLPCVLLLVPLVAGGWAANEEEEELPVFRPGLVATYSQEGAAAVRRIDDDLQFVSRGGEAPDERLAAGPFAAQWRGRLHSLTSGEYRLHAFVAGR